MPTVAEVTSQVETRLAEVSLPASISGSVLQAIDAAGYALTPKAGGSAVATLSAVTPTRTALAGMQGVFVVEATLASGRKVAWLETHLKAGGVERLALGNWA